MRKVIAIVFMIILVALSACSQGTDPVTSESATKAPAQSDASGGQVAVQDDDTAVVDSIYGHIDMSQHVKLKMFLVGTKAEDSEIVMDHLSEKLQDRINASLEVEYLPWSDYSVKYSLVLAGSEQIDMIFSGDWCYYATEANKGAFYELTEEFIQTYMPLTYQNQNPVAFEQSKLGGKMYMITSNAAGIEGESWFVIRGDLREKYAMEEITTQEQLEEYFKLVVENEPGVFPYAAAEGVPFFHILYEQKNNLNNVSENWITKYVDDADIPSVDDIFYRFLSPEYLEFARLMKQYADWGFWSKSAISNTTQTRDSFENGKSASLVWNQTIFLAGTQLEKNNSEWKAEYVDLNPGTIRRATLYTNGGTAIAAVSKNPERSAMLIDSLLHVPELNDTFKGGIEGTHWIDAGERYYQPGADYDKYQWNHAQWAFNTPFDEARLSTETSEFQIQFEEQNYEWVVHPTYEMFRFDREPVKTEWAAVDALETEYRPMLELGITDDPAATIEELRQKLYAAGFDRVEEEFKKQYEAWAASL